VNVALNRCAQLSLDVNSMKLQILQSMQHVSSAFLDSLVLVFDQNL